MINKLKSNISNWVKGSIGWKTNRKILVFESDDWGSIRMPSRKVYASLVSKGIKLDSPGGGLFNRYDTLASEDDLTALFDVLHSVKDKNNNPAVFTAVSVVANPDFEKIKKNGFDQYYHEPFTTTLEKYQGHNRTFELWKQGLEQKIFVPQSHGREHLNTIMWMENLQKGDKETLVAFDHGMWAFDKKENQLSYQVAFAVNKASDIDIQKNIVAEGLMIFDQLFGYKSTLFVPPNGLLHPTIEQITYENEVKLLYGSHIFKIPKTQYKERYSFRYLGLKNNFGQRYIVRNCIFEPNEPGVDWLGVTLKEIENAFSCGKPAILGPHRKNFIGSIEESNRTTSLKILKKLLQEVVKKWPEIEFMTTTELGVLMHNA